MDFVGSKSREPVPVLQDKPEIVRQIRASADQADLDRTMAELTEKALNAGAADAIVINVAALRPSLAVLERVKADAGYPSAHWPAHYPNDDIQAALLAYKTGILYRVDAPPGMPEYGGGPINDPDHRLACQRVYEIATLLESGAFYLGYHLCLGFATGNCRAVFCHDENRCWAMVKGRCCVRPYRARPGMAAIGLDADTMAREAEWTWQGPLLAGLVMVY